MASQTYSWLLQVYLLLMLVHPLDPSYRPERDMGTSGLPPEELKPQDVDPDPTPLFDMALLSCICLVMELLMTSVFLGCCLGRRLRRRWREEKNQSPEASARPCCCRGRGCPKKLMQLLRHNRALLRLCLHYRPPQKRTAKRAAKGGIWKRRLRAFPQR